MKIYPKVNLEAKVGVGDWNYQIVCVMYDRDYRGRFVKSYALITEVYYVNTKKHGRVPVAFASIECGGGGISVECDECVQFFKLKSHNIKYTLTKQAEIAIRDARNYPVLIWNDITKQFMIESE